MPVSHNFTCAIPDDPVQEAAGYVVPTHWNDTHAVNITSGDLDPTLQDGYFVRLDGSNQASWTPTTTVVTNLNADLLDGQHGSYYAPLSGAIVKSPTAIEDNLITIPNATYKGLVIKAAAAQTADPFQVQNSSGATTVRVSSSSANPALNIIGASTPYGQLGLFENATELDGTTFTYELASDIVTAGSSKAYVLRIRDGSASGTQCFSLTKSTRNITIGENTKTAGTNVNSLAIGKESQATHDNSIVIGTTTGSAVTSFASTSITLGLEGYRNLTVNGSGLVGINTISQTARLEVVGSSDIIQFKVKAHSSQTANLQQWQNSSGTVLSFVDSAGSITAPGINITTATDVNPVLKFTDGSGYWEIYQNAAATVESLVFAYNGAAATDGFYIDTSNHAHFGAYAELYASGNDLVMNPRLSGAGGNILLQTRRRADTTAETQLQVMAQSGFVGIGTTPTAQLHVLSDASTDVTAKFQGASSQTANLTEWQNSSGTVLATVTSGGQVGVGTSTPRSRIAYSDLTIEKQYVDADGTATSVSALSVLHFSGDSTRPTTRGSGLLMGFAGGTQAAPTAVQTTERLGFFLATGYDGAAWQNPAGINFVVDGTVSSGLVPTKIDFVTGSSAGTRATRMSIASGGGIAIGTTDDGQHGINLNFAKASASTIYGLEGNVSNTSTGSVYGTKYLAISSGGGNLVYGVNGIARRTIAGSGAQVAGGVFSAETLVGSTTTNLYGVLSVSPTITGTVTNAYGLYVEPVSGATNNYAIFTNTGLNELNDQLFVDGSADRVQFIIQGHSAQTADLQQWQNSSGTVLTQINASGFLGIGPASFTVDKDIHIQRTDGTATIRLERNDTTITAGDIYGTIEWEGQDASAGANDVRADIRVIARPAGGASGDVQMQFRTARASATTLYNTLSIDNNSVYINGDNDGVTGLVPLYVRGSNGQTAALTNWQSYDGATNSTVAQISALGRGGFGQSTSSIYTLAATATTGDQYVAGFTGAGIPTIGGINLTGGVANTGTGIGFRSAMSFTPTVDNTTVYSCNFNCQVSGARPITTAYGARGLVTLDSGHSAVLTNAYAFYAENADNNGIGTVTNAYGLYLEEQNLGGTLNYNIFSAGSTSKNVLQGFVVIGAATPSTSSGLEIAGSTGPIVTLRRNDSTIAANDSIGKIQFYAADTSTTSNFIVANIEAQATNTITTDINPGRLIFRTTPTTVAATPVERVRITEAGMVDAYYGVFVDGVSDIVQLRVQGHSTQTSDHLQIQNSSATNLAKVTALGSISTKGRQSAISTKTTNHTAILSDEVLLCDATGGAITITLPTAASAYDSTIGSGQVFTIKKIDSSVNTVTIDGDGSEVIDGATTQVISTQWTAITITSNGTSWYII